MILLALGTNLGDRLENVRTALRLLRESSIAVKSISSIYESAALLPENAPPEWDIPYYNLVVAVETDLSPDALLETTQSIQTQMGREDQGRWGPRMIDIDILAYDDAVLATPQLQIPHPLMLVRDFVMVPLAEIAPHWRHPITCELAAGCLERAGFGTHAGLVRLEEGRE